jgi:hypothetical protein
MNAKRLLFLFSFMLLLIPAAALAANHNVTGGTFGLSICAAGVALALNGVSFDNFLASNTCVLSFTGVGNTLILSGNNTLKSGINEPGSAQMKAEKTPIERRDRLIKRRKPGPYAPVFALGLCRSSFHRRRQHCLQHREVVASSAGFSLTSFEWVLGKGWVTRRSFPRRCLL